MSIEIVINSIKKEFSDMELQRLAVDLFVNSSSKQEILDRIDKFMTIMKNDE